MYLYEVQPGTDLGAMCKRYVPFRDDPRFEKAAQRWARMRGLAVSFRAYNVHARGTVYGRSLVYREVG